MKGKQVEEGDGGGSVLMRGMDDRWEGDGGLESDLSPLISFPDYCVCCDGGIWL